MANRLVFEVQGIRELRERFAAAAREGPQVAAQALLVWAEEVMTDAKELVPVRDGILRASGFVDLPAVTPDQVSVTFGFGGPSAPYALAVHENPRAGKTGGVSPSGKKYRRWAQVGQWKYLETALKRRVLPPRALAVFEEGLITRAGLRTMATRARNPAHAAFAPRVHLEG